jgi:hypothetical protein
VVLQWCYSGGTVVLQWCYSVVTVVVLIQQDPSRNITFCLVTSQQTSDSRKQKEGNINNLDRY